MAKKKGGKGNNKKKVELSGVVAAAADAIAQRKAPSLDKIKEDLQKGYSGYYNFFTSLDQLRNYRKNNKDVIFDKDLGALIENNLTKIDFSKERIALEEVNELLSCLDSIGLDRLPPNILKITRDFFDKFFDNVKRNPNSSRAIKNLVHFLVHCKNLSVFAKKDDLPLMDKLQEAVEVLSKYIVKNQRVLSFNNSTIQASFDFLSYMDVIHKIKSDTSQQAFEILSKKAKDLVSIDSSGFHEEVFTTLQDIIERKSPDQDHYKSEWSHIAQTEYTEDGRKRATYAGTISLEMEGDLEIDRYFYRNGDIVIRDLDTQNVISVIEVDGPTHFFHEGRISGKTHIRNEMLKELYGDWFFSVTCNGEAQSDSAKIAHEIKQILDRAIESNIKKNAIEYREKRETEEQASRANSSSSFKILSEDVFEEDPVVALSEEEILKEQTREFQEILQNNLFDDLEPMLVNKEVIDYLKSIKIEERDPLDFVLNKINAAHARREKLDEKLLNIAIMLYIYGFNYAQDQEANYPPEIAAIFLLKKENPPKITFDKLEELVDLATDESVPIKDRSNALDQIKNSNLIGLQRKGSKDFYKAECESLKETVRILIEKKFNKEIFSPIIEELFSKIIKITEVKAFYLKDSLNFLLKKGEEAQLIDFIRENKEDIKSQYLNSGFKSDFLAKIVIKNYLSTLEILTTECGFEVKESNLKGENLLHRASAHGSLDIVNFLISKGVRPVANKDGITPLNIASNQGHLDVVKTLLLNTKVNINHANKAGVTAIYDASIKKGNLETVKALINAGANPDLADKNEVTPLYAAAYHGNSDIAKVLIDAGANLNHTTTEKDTPLYIAACMGHLDVVKILIDAGADLNLVKDGERAPLNTAVFGKHSEVAKLLIDAGANPNLAGKESKITPLYTASFDGDLKTVKALINAGADLNMANKDKDTPLYVAYYNKHLDVVKALIEAGADLNLKNKDGATALCVAASDGSLEMVNILINAGANLDLTNNEELTPLSAAVSKGHFEIVKALIEAGANLNLPNKNNITPLYNAVSTGSLDMVSALIEAGADPNLVDKNGISPLYVAAYYGHSDIAKALMEKNADKNQVTIDNDTPLYIAANQGHFEVVKDLIEAGADLNLPNKDNITPLYSAAFKGHLDIVSALIKAGADLNITKKDGSTPLYSAALGGHLDVVKTLIEAKANLDLAKIEGFTPLYAALFAKKFDVARLLVKAGANPDLAEHKNAGTPLHYAVQNNCLESVKVLIEAKANLNLADMLGHFPLSYAIMKGSEAIDIVWNLICAGAKLDNEGARIIKEGLEKNPKNSELKDFSKDPDVLAKQVLSFVTRCIKEGSNQHPAKSPEPANTKAVTAPRSQEKSSSKGHTQ